MRHTIELTEDETRRVNELLVVCQTKQGEYLSALNSGWATTYSSEFVDAAAELFNIYSNGKIAPPIHGQGTRYFLTVIFDLMATLFSSNGIRSCRKSVMDRENVRYLFEAHIYRKLYKTVR